MKYIVAKMEVAYLVPDEDVSLAKETWFEKINTRHAARDWSKVGVGTKSLEIRVLNPQEFGLWVEENF